MLICYCQFFEAARPPPALLEPTTRPQASFMASVDKGAKEYADQSLFFALCAVAAESLEKVWATKVVEGLKEAEEEARRGAEDEIVQNAQVLLQEAKEKS